MKYSQKIFGAFQRLYNADDFPGNDIEGAAEQRFIRRRGGNVWAESALKKGTTIIFYNTLNN